MVGGEEGRIGRANGRDVAQDDTAEVCDVVGASAVEKLGPGELGGGGIDGEWGVRQAG